ncbi:DUF3883 domain-containing protein [Candidatus Spongiihabitans sp.]|uniref:DUF3883 domain-containing protein n=1 Tax=Candidatus Spongiihabitans sp. TaxID=3101308 RepID=UPI003C7B8BB3
MQLELNNLLLCNITWMRHYQDINDQDRPYRGGKYVEETGDAEEKYNFYDWSDGYFYGYSPPPGKIKIENLGAVQNDSSVSGITVVWTAMSPLGGKRVVGWYKNALVFREIREEDGVLYRMCAKTKDCHLIHADERRLEVPKGKGRPALQSPVSYGRNLDIKDKKNKLFLRQLADLLNGVPANQTAQKPHSKRSRGDVEKRMAVEREAVECVQTYFEDDGWVVASVENDNVGWDLTVTKSNRELHVEVKGHQGNRINCELTPNEYKHAKRKNHDYCLAVVTETLEKPYLRIFQPDHKSKGAELKWYCIVGVGKVKTEEKIGAVISEK